MKNIIEELKKYPDCNNMVELHQKITAEIDAHISKAWGYFEFVEDIDGSLVAPFPEGPEIDEIGRVVPKLDDMAKEIEADAEVIIDVMGGYRPVSMLEKSWEIYSNEISKAEEKVFAAIKECIKEGIDPNDARKDPRVVEELRGRDIILKTHKSRVENLRDRIDQIKLILGKYENIEVDDF